MLLIHLEKENTAPEENDTSKKSNILETKNTEWEDLKNEILNNLSNELDPKGKENWGALIEEIKNILSANDSKLLKIVIYYKLSRGFIIGWIIISFLLLAYILFFPPFFLYGRMGLFDK